MAIRLRAIEPEDLDFLYTIENDTRLWDASCNNAYYSRYLLSDYVAHCNGDIYTDKQQRLVIEADSDNEVVGLADLINFEPRHQRAEVGIVIRSACRGRGYAGEALQQVITYARQILHLHQLYAYIAADNQVSLDLFTCLGFKPVARLEDWICRGNDYQDVFLMQYFL